jgi:hypothetical protein
MKREKPENDRRESVAAQLGKDLAGKPQRLERKRGKAEAPRPSGDRRGAVIHAPLAACGAGIIFDAARSI